MKNNIRLSSSQLKQKNETIKKRLDEQPLFIRTYEDKKEQSFKISGFLKSEVETLRQASIVQNCSKYVKYLGVQGKAVALKQVFLCKSKLCPICSSIRANQNYNRLKDLDSRLKESGLKNPNYLFLTLTMKNSALKEIGSSLSVFNTGLNRLKRMKEYKRAIKGEIKVIEITYNQKDNSVNTHIHLLAVVDGDSYFKSDYLSQAVLAELWQKALKVDYQPVVHIEKVTNKKGNTLENALKETIKYSLKSTDLSKSKEFTLAIAKQTKNRRFLSLGGLVREVFKAESEEVDRLDEEALYEAESEEVDSSFIADCYVTYYWYQGRYIKFVEPLSNTNKSFADTA